MRYLFVLLLLWADPATAIEIRQADDAPIVNVRGQHPRRHGQWVQYWGLDTALRANVVFSDVVYPSSRFESFQGVPKPRHGLDGQTASNYDNLHNHYQNLLAEVLNFAPETNAIAVWGDSWAVANGANAWGGFLSARSGCRDFLLTLSDDAPSCDGDYDAQIIGLEIDVLNDAKPGVYPNKSKTGLQIVGFGVPNSMAIEIRSEDTDKTTTEMRRGVFESGIYVKNSLAPYGRLVVADFDHAKIGIDLRRPLFDEGAISLRTEQVGSGVIFNNGASGEVYGGLRWPAFADERQWLSLRLGAGGLRMVSNDNSREVFAVDNHGGIYFSGDLFINGHRVNGWYPSFVLILLAIAIIGANVLWTLWWTKRMVRRALSEGSR